ncbi:hypothetical protein [Pseudophaeobacter sp.]|jgi:hypothetical protein|uniref:hypothetical protein n=1 Tax=Pseudophaeobacter sp. TaxID=1971739 RepID=UPI0032D8F26C
MMQIYSHADEVSVKGGFEDSAHQALPTAAVSPKQTWRSAKEVVELPFSADVLSE